MKKREQTLEEQVINIAKEFLEKSENKEILAR